MNIDTGIFITFLIANMIFGLYSSRGIKNIREYAIGNRDFSTATIAATLIATWISGSAFLTDISEAYKDGLFYMVPGMLGDLISWFIICYFIAPRVGEFLGTLSVAEAMGNLYGSKVRLITALSSIFNCIGKVAAQFKVSATILQLFFGVSSFQATIFSSAIVVIYSTFGGIKAVTFTDIIQFFTFGTLIPIITLIIWGTFDDPYVVFHTLNENPIFDYRQLFDHNHPKFWGALTLALYFIIPSLNPAIFQRIAMAKDTLQVARSFTIATFTRLFISIMFFWIAILLMSKNPNLEPSKLFAYIIDNFTYIGFKGFLAAGVMAMVMSTADSYINAGTVTFSYDLRKSLNIEWPQKYDLIISYACSLLIGILAFVLAFYMKGLLSLFLMVSSFYLPIVTVPLLSAIFGFRSSSKSVLIGMAAGFITVLIWRRYLMDTGIDSVIPGLIGNLVFFLGSHYLLGQSGGWIGIKDNAALNLLLSERKFQREKIISSIKNFNLLGFCKNNLPKQETTYIFFGFFSIISIFSTMYSLPIGYRNTNQELINFIYHSVLIASSLFLSYPIWPSRFRSDNFMSVIWSMLVPYILIIASLWLVVISNFSQLQLMVFMINLIILSTIFKWQTALSMIIVATLVSIKSYPYFGGHNLASLQLSLHFKIMYSLLLFSSILIVFLRPKQKIYQIAEEKAEHLASTMGYKDEELQKALMLKNEFIRNVTHEYHAPMTGVINTAEALLSGYQFLDDEGRIKAIETIYNSAIRLESFDANIRDLARLSSGESELNITKINLSDLVNQRLEVCKKLYIDNAKQIDYLFITNIEDNVLVEADEYYITQTLDNLITNAFSYCKQGKIELLLEKKNNYVSFSITDQGIGIPKDELFDIFGEFTVSSKTRTPAGGRGVGLALCKKVLEMHKGIIKANSGNGQTTFIFSMPLIFEDLTKTPTEEMIEVAKRMLNNNIDLKLIIKITGLKESQIKALRY